MRRLRFLAAALSIALLTCLPRATAAQETVYLTGFPTLRQQRALTCESSAASMATRGVVGERRIMAAMPRSPNPNLGFRGNPNGRQGTSLVDYGVYAQPVHNVLLKFGYQSDVLMYQPDWTLMSYINRGWPVETWITYALQRATPRLASWNGEEFFLVPHEHAVLVVGYTPTGVIANDPWTGRVVAYDWRNFNRAWGYFGRMALAVQPCPMPSPVRHLRVTVSQTTGVTWTWRAAANADHYEIVVWRLDNESGVIWHGNSHTNRYTVQSPGPGAEYEIAVRAVSACGGTSGWARLWVQLPPAVATPTGTPPTEATMPPQPSATGTPGATGTPTVSPTSTP